MKNLLVIILLLSLYSCKKSNTIDGKKKAVDRAVICLEKPVVSKTEDFVIGVRYFKNYSDQDDISLTLNGNQGIIKGTTTSSITGTNYLFKFAPVGTAGDFELVLSIKNGLSNFIAKKTLRVIENNNIGTVWDSFEYGYMVSTFPLMNYATSANFAPVPTGSFEPALALFMVYYAENYRPNPDSVYTTSLLSGINGRYIANYTEAKILKNITVLSSEPLRDPNAVSYEGVLDEVAAVYGPATATTTNDRGQKITRFETERFAINVHEYLPGYTGQLIGMIITLK